MGKIMYTILVTATPVKNCEISMVNPDHILRCLR